jgi:hypothetical protein
MFLQPGEERRRSGSHYTPRSLTQPIVERTLAPVLAAMGEHPTPEAILALRVCDPAMGSGAFLVEACRQLATRLEAAWKHHDAMPAIPADEDPHLHARRRVAQRCLYGVDRNPLAVDLARLSLWLETFARDHAFTFVDHCLRHGDSLVGLSLDQIASVSLDTRKGAQLDLVRTVVTDTLARVRALRREIHAAGDGDPPDNDGQRSLWREAQDALLEARTVGDLVVAGFFSQKTDRDRAKWVAGQHAAIMDWLAKKGTGEALRSELRRVLGARGIVPFHWQLEFPEVFDGERGGFDAFVGNPPFMGGTIISTQLGMGYFEYLTSRFPPAEHLCDLVAYFFRRAFDLLRPGGAMGLVATNSIAQGDTREGGLSWICTHGGMVFNATRRYVWPGVAVVVSVVHVYKGVWGSRCELDGREVPMITAFLFGGGGHSTPARLPGQYFSLGSKIYGQGFVFDDEDPKASPDIERLRVTAADRKYMSRILPYIGGEELNTSPTQSPRRHVMYLSDIETEAQLRAEWPELERIVRAKVKPERDSLGDNPNNVPLKRRWWAYQAHRPELYRAIHGKRRVLANSQVSSHCVFAWCEPGWVFAHTAIVYPIDSDGFFAALQSRIHETWARFFSSSSLSLLRYTPSDCFETFPFPRGWEESAALEAIGRRYNAHRAAVMKRTIGTKKPEGLTATYNRFHDPNERGAEIATLRALHAEMDRAVLDAYGWTDLRPAYDYRVQLDERVRYTWDDDTRDEVLARLLEENRQRAGASAAAAQAQVAADEAAVASAAPAKRGRKKSVNDAGGPGLPGVE